MRTYGLHRAPSPLWGLAKLAAVVAAVGAFLLWLAG